MGVFVDFSRIFLLGILIFKGLNARRLYKSFGVKGLIRAITFIGTLLCDGMYGSSYMFRHFIARFRESS
jgi:hypothetical protein